MLLVIPNLLVVAQVVAEGTTTKMKARVTFHPGMWRRANFVHCCKRWFPHFSFTATVTIATMRGNLIVLVALTMKSRRMRERTCYPHLVSARQSDSVVIDKAEVGGTVDLVTCSHRRLLTLWTTRLLPHCSNISNNKSIRKRKSINAVLVKDVASRRTRARMMRRFPLHPSPLRNIAGG